MRYGLGFPFDEDGVTIGPSFLENKKEAQRLHDAGFDLMGGTFGPGSYQYDPVAGGTVWVPSVSSWARGLKHGNPAAKPGINLGFMNEYAEWLLGELYRCEDSPFDYIGIDGYMGSWQEGGPDDWKWYIDKAYALTGKPVIINEWGYSTLQRGPNPDPEAQRKYNQTVCRDKSWVLGTLIPPVCL